MSLQFRTFGLSVKNIDSCLLNDNIANKRYLDYKYLGEMKLATLRVIVEEHRVQCFQSN